MNGIILYTGNFITSTSPDFRSACAVELCGCLAALQSLDRLLTEAGLSIKLDLIIATNCQGVIRKLSTEQKFITINTPLRPIVREIMLLRLNILKKLEFTKVDAHLDDLYELEQLSFLENFNVQCDTRDKALILNTGEGKVMSFPLHLTSAYVINKDNESILDYPKNISLQVYLSHCEEYLGKKLKIPEISSVD